jgi:hypothetical protein
MSRKGRLSYRVDAPCRRAIGVQCNIGVQAHALEMRHPNHGAMVRRQDGGTAHRPWRRCIAMTPPDDFPDDPSALFKHCNDGLRAILSWQCKSINLSRCRRTNRAGLSRI